ncbi:MAG: YidB family protein [Steroidobacteraceae bacterium]
MGMLDGIIKSVVGGAMGGEQQAQLMAVVESLLSNNRGLSGLVSAFSKAGPNLPVSAAQLTQVFGSGQMEQAAEQLGVNSSQAGDMLSKFLPQLVDQLTPNGQATDDHSGDKLNSTLGALAGKLFG